MLLPTHGLASPFVLAFGACASSSGKFDRIARPGIESVREPDSLVMVERGHRSIARAYNQLIERAAGCEGMILVHDDVRLEDPATCASVRSEFHDGAAIVGVIGGCEPRSLAWWGTSVYGRAIQGGEEIVGPDGRGRYEVDVVDGIFLALSSWALTNLRFDERYLGFDGYDGDICAQARAAGRPVVVIDLDLVHDHEVGHRDGGRSWRRADWRWRSKWLGVSPVRRALYRARCHYVH